LSLQKAITDCLEKCDVELQKDIASDICLIGGNTMFPGFPERLQKELRNSPNVPYEWRVKVNSLPDRKHAVFKGGQNFIAASGHDQILRTSLSKNEYDYCGPVLMNSLAI